MLLPERLEGAIYGHLVGDALSVPYEGTPAHRIGAVEWRGHGTYDQLLGTWSDDGALMLALLDSLLTRRFDRADQAQRALDWKDHGAHAPGGLVFDIGDSTAQALAQLRLVTTPEQAGAASAKGNGSLMRILPVALVLRDLDDDALVAGAVRASRVTHGSAEAQVACALYTLVVRRLLQGKTDRPGVLDAARRALRIVLQERGLPGSKEAGSPPEAVAALDAFEAWSGREGRGRVVDCFWSAWDAFAGADDYVAAITEGGEVRHRYHHRHRRWAGRPVLGHREYPLGMAPWLRDRHLAQESVDWLIETDDAEWSGTPWRTSTRSPLRVDWMDLSGTDLAASGGQASLTFLPGKRYMGYYTGPHWRDLDSDAAALRRQEVDVLLLLVEDHELEHCRATDVAEVLPAHGVELVRHPLVDLERPAHDRAHHERIAKMVVRVRAGEKLAIACRGGLDRAGMTSTCLLREAGLDADTAIDRVHAARRCTLTRPQQVQYVRAWS